MEFAKIVAFGLFAAIAYGVIHDQVTARVCLEYFTIGHPALIRTSSPTLLALTWGSGYLSPSSQIRLWSDPEHVYIGWDNSLKVFRGSPA